MRIALLRLAGILYGVLVSSVLFAQYNISENNTWVMGNQCGLNFNNNPPTVFATSMYAFEASAAVSNDSGQLLFYSNGTDVWTAAGALMPHGTSINNIPNHTLSSTQGALIVPDPADRHRYYLFSCAGQGLFVNVVDMRLNSGTGDIDTGYIYHGVALRDTMTEKMVAVRGCNKNVWVLTRSISSIKPQFLAYEVTAAGVDTIPVTSAVGQFGGSEYFQGQMKVSPDKKKVVAVAAGITGIEMFDFDYVSGKLSNAVLMDSSFTFAYGCAFSPKSTKLYVNRAAGELWQYDLTSSDIAGSRILLGDGGYTSQLQLAVDGRIYFRSGEGPGNTFLGRINYPDVTGPGCGLQNPVASLAYPNMTTAGLRLDLPGTVVKASDTLEPPYNRHYMDTALCIKEDFAGLVLYAVPGFTAYVWDNLTTGATRNVLTTGNYWVKYMTACGPRTDSFIVQMNTITPLLLNFINGVLSANHPYTTYQWYKGGVAVPGATGQSFPASDTGWYVLKVTNSTGCTDSAAYHVTEPTAIGDPDPAIKDVYIYPNPVTDVLHVISETPVRFHLSDVYSRVLKSAEGNVLALPDLTAGFYLLHVFDRKDGRLLGVRKVMKR